MYIIFILQIDYPDVHVMKSGPRAGPCNSMDRLPQQYDTQDDIRLRRMNSDQIGLQEQVLHHNGQADLSNLTNFPVQ